MTIFVGIDISKDTFDVNVKATSGKELMKPRQYKQSKDDIDKFISDIKSIAGNEELMIGLEATGRYHVNLSDYLIKQGLPLVIFNPMETSSLRKWNIRKSKNDSIDASVVSNALCLEKMESKVRHVSEDDKLKLKELVTIYHRLVGKVSNLKRELRLCLNNLCPGYEPLFDNIFSGTSYAILKKVVKQTKLFKISEEEILRILINNHNRKNTRDKLASDIYNAFQKSTCPGYMVEARVFEVKSILGQYDVLTKQLHQVNGKIVRYYSEMNQYVSTIKGVGTIIGATALGILGNVNRFTSLSALDAYVGLDPVHESSGKSLHRMGHISKRGNRILRSVLLNGALVAMKYNPVIRTKYHQLRDRGKNHGTAIIACARKLLHIIYSVEKNQKSFYIPEYIESG